MDTLPTRGGWLLTQIRKCRWHKSGRCMEWVSKECPGLVPNFLLTNLPEFLYQCKPTPDTEGMDPCQ